METIRENAGYMNQIFPKVSSAFLTHYQTTNFRLFETERVCRRQFRIQQKWKKVIQTGRIHCGKRRNCSLQAISPFPTVFSKGLFPRGIQRCVIVWEWVKTSVGKGWIKSFHKYPVVRVWNAIPPQVS